MIHYSATYPDRDVTAADIDRIHRARTPPFRATRYHFFIRRHGTVEPGCAETELGAHVTRMLISTAMTILAPYLIYAAEPTLEVRLNDSAWNTLGSASWQRRRMRSCCRSAM